MTNAIARRFVRRTDVPPSLASLSDLMPRLPRAVLTATEADWWVANVRAAVERGDLPSTFAPWLPDLEQHLAAKVGVSRNSGKEEALLWLDAVPVADEAATAWPRTRLAAASVYDRVRHPLDRRAS